MKYYRLLFSLLFLLPVFLFGQSPDKYITDRLIVPGPIHFGSKTYNLIRTSFIPDTATYNTYRQEYLPAGDTIKDYKNLLFINVYTGNADMVEIANTKLDELKELKLTNPFVGYETLNNKKTGELMIDFMTSENSPDGQYIDEAERCIYRYLTMTDKSGKDYVVLLGVCIRAVGDDVEAFLAEHKSKSRVNFTRDVAKFVTPIITLPKE